MYSTQSDLIGKLMIEGIIKSKQIAKALQYADRKHYTAYSPYYDAPQTLGYGATISAPHMHAYALQYLKKHLQKAKYVLDVGSGTGYLTVAMSYLTPKQCKVYGIQHVPQLVQKSRKNIQADHPQLLDKKKIVIKEGDGRKGWKEENLKFDAIHVGAAAEDIPEKLIQQLAQGGRMLIPVGNVDSIQNFMAIDKINGNIKKTYISPVRYVPLTDLKKQLHPFG